MGPEEFIVHDVSEFPIVWSRNAAIIPGYAPQWSLEMDALLARGTAFVIIFGEGSNEEAHEDRSLRARWLKKNKALLATRCRSVIAIEPSAMKRAALLAQTAIATKAFGIPVDIAASRQLAYEAAQRRLATAESGHATD